jgi:hypothetical protein
MNAPPIELIAGQPFTIAFQCFVRGTGTVAAVFNSTDTLTSSVIQSQQTVAIFNPTPVFYTANSTQNGSDQGQVQVTGTKAQAAMLVPSTSYTLEVWRTLVSDPSNPDLIVRAPLVIKPLAV